MIAVFDFDRTLINKDSLFGFYKIMDAENRFFTLKRYILLMAAVAYKLKLFSNTQLKKIGVLLFLKGKSKHEIDLRCAEYAKSLLLNDIYNSAFCTLKDKGLDCIVVSAGYLEYLCHVLPKEKVYGSSLKYAGGKVVGVQENLYSKNKVDKLHKLGMERCEVLFTDSFADKPLMDIAKCVFLVKDGRVISKTGSCDLINSKWITQ